MFNSYAEIAYTCVFQVYWSIFGPNNPQAALQATNDIAYVSGNREYTSGTLVWIDGQSGEQTFTLDIKPFTSWEIEKSFVIRLEKVQGSPVSIGHGEVSPTTGSVVLTVSRLCVLYRTSFHIYSHLLCSLNVNRSGNHSSNLNVYSFQVI